MEKIDELKRIEYYARYIHLLNDKKRLLIEKAEIETDELAKIEMKLACLNLEAEIEAKQQFLDRYKKSI